MSYTPYTPFADSAHDRRHRRPMQAVAGHPDIPVYERHAETVHAAGRGTAMGLVLRMDATGLWVIRLNGELAEVGGRCYWETLGDLQAAATRAGLTLSDLTIHTGQHA